MHLPGPLRAAVGLVVSAAQEARNLPDRAIELPMLAISTALQASLRAQQRYARLTALGDEVLHRRMPTEEPPAWATFDEPVSVEDLRRAALNGAASDPLFENLFGVAEPSAEPVAPASEVDFGPAVPELKKIKKPKSAMKQSAPKKAAAKKSGAKNVNKPRHTAPSAFDDVGSDVGDSDREN